jgi:N-acetylglucosamine-6-phosphate deacetylase
MPAAIEFVNGRLLDPEASELVESSLRAEGDRIAAMIPAGHPSSSARKVDLEGRVLAPGYLDIHFHGSLPFASSGAIADSLGRDAEALARHGVTSFLPTTVAWNDAALMDRVIRLAKCVNRASSPASDPLGVHLEGPWIAASAAGAQPAAAIRPYDAAEGRAVLDAAEGSILMVTLAPEVAGAPTLLDELGRRGIVAALGHSRANARQVEDAIGAGLCHVTHLFNAMTGLHHRERGVAGVALTDDRLTCDLICDGCHVHPSVVALAARAKGEALLLISDRIDPPADAADFGAGPVRDDGTALRLPGGALAGSTLYLDRAVQLAVRFGAMTLHEAVSAATLRPARLLGIEAQRGTLRPGARADFVVLEDDGTLCETWLAGDRVGAPDRPPRSSSPAGA